MTCSICGARATVVVLDLGRQPAADHFPVHTDPGPDPVHGLAMRLCLACNAAGLDRDDTTVEEPRAVEPAALREQAARAVARLTDSGLLRPGTRVVEYGSPHGGTWWPLLEDVGAVRATGAGTADLVLDIFGLMHERDPETALRAQLSHLAPGGAVLLQVHSLATVVEHRQWTSLRHGHHWYFSLHALRHLLGRVGLTVQTCLHDELYGGTVLAVARVGGTPDATVRAELDREDRLGLGDPSSYLALQATVDRGVDDLRERWTAAVAAGRTVHAYGAGSRAVALLALAAVHGVAPESVADASSGKQGRRMPGTGVPIVAPATLVAADPGEIWLLIPELLDEVRRTWPEIADRVVVVGPAERPDDRLHHPIRRLPRSTAAQRRLHDLVPGGSHTYARGSDQYPDDLAPVLVRGRGAQVWDVDGHSYVEYGMGLRSVTLGHAHPAVTAAVQRELHRGNNFTRPGVLEAAAAEDFLRLVPTADMVKFCKNGSDATTAAVRLARAVTGRTTVAVADQPFFSVDDWFIGTTPMAAGIPAAGRADTVRFGYNDLASLEQVLREHRVAAVVLEAASATAEPEPGFLQGVRHLCDRHGSVLVFDEIITGFRWGAAGAQGHYGVQPDLSTWGKAMGNGFPIAALAGRRDLMERGGLRTDAERVFLLSTTHGAESTGLAAFRAVAAAYVDDAPVRRMEAAGERLAAGVTAAVLEAGLSDHVTVRGRPSCLVFGTADQDGRPSQALRTLFLAELVGRGVLGQSFVVSAAHDDRLIDHTVDAVRAALPAYRRALDTELLPDWLGRPVAPALRATARPRRESNFGGDGLSPNG